MNSSRSFTWLCAERNLRKGSFAFLLASNSDFTLASEKMSLVSETFPASSYIWRATGTMMKIVSTNASPVMIWFGGTCCVPIAFRKIESTTEIFTKDVSITTMKGASAKVPRTMTITTGFATCPPVCACANCGSRRIPKKKERFISAVCLPCFMHPMQHLPEISSPNLFAMHRRKNLHRILRGNLGKAFHFSFRGADQKNLRARFHQVKSFPWFERISRHSLNGAVRIGAQSKKTWQGKFQNQIGESQHASQNYENLDILEDRRIDHGKCIWRERRGLQREEHHHELLQRNTLTPRLPSISTNSPSPRIFPFTMSRTGSVLPPSSSTMLPGPSDCTSARVNSFSPTMTCNRSGNDSISGLLTVALPSRLISTDVLLSKYLSIWNWPVLLPSV